MARIPRADEVLYSEGGDEMHFSIGDGPIVMTLDLLTGELTYWEDDDSATDAGKVDHALMRLAHRKGRLGDLIANYFLIPYLRRRARRRNPGR